jgi:hypothetical protein
MYSLVHWMVTIDWGKENLKLLAFTVMTSQIKYYTSFTIIMKKLFLSPLLFISVILK